MAQVISLQDALHIRSETQSCPPAQIGRSGLAAVSSLANRPALNNEDIDRAILLLDTAAEQAQLAVMQASDPSCRELVETQSRTIMQLLGLAGSVTSRLE